VHVDAAAEDGLLGDEALTEADGVGDDPGVGLDGEPSGDLLALGRGGHQHGGRRLGGDELGEQLGLGGDDVADDVLGAGDVDLVRAVLGQFGLGLGGDAGAGPDGGGRAEGAGEGQQLQRDLLDLSVDLLNENENLRHISNTPALR
jgi:hypothetical protein